MAGRNGEVKKSGIALPQGLELEELSVASALAKEYPVAEVRRVLIVSGPGNNGGRLTLHGAGRGGAAVQAAGAGKGANVEPHGGGRSLEPTETLEWNNAFPQEKEPSTPIRNVLARVCRPLHCADIK